MSKSSGSGGSESYFDIDDILASQEKIPCKFEVPVYNLGKFKDQITAPCKLPKRYGFSH